MLLILFLSYLSLFVGISFLGKLLLFLNIMDGKMFSFSEFFSATLWGLRFDASIATVPSLFLAIGTVYFSGRKKLLWFFLSASALLYVLIISGDVMYFLHVGRHITYEYKTLLKNFTDLIKTAFGEYLILSIFILLFLSLLGWLLRRCIDGLTNISQAFKKTSRLQYLVQTLIVIFVAIIIFRGGFQKAPLKVQHYSMAKNSQQMMMGWNPVYYIFHSFFLKAEAKGVSLSSQEEIDHFWKKYFSQRSLKEIAPQEKLNVIFILLESWSGEYSLESPESAKIVPHLYKMYQESLTTRGTVAGGLRTSEGMYSIFCSQQNPLGQSVADGSLYFGNYDCLPHYLVRHGWASQFFQGTLNETSNVGPFAQKIGFQKSFGKYEYENKKFPKNNWGYYDQDIYEHVLDVMDRLPQPFLIGINTNTTHSIELPTGIEYRFGRDTMSQTYKSVLHFADEALGEFIDQLKNKPYFKNTILILVSDHSGYSEKKQETFRFLIPSLIYSPSRVLPQKISRFTSQRDIAPTVVDLLKGYLPSLAGSSWTQPDLNSIPAPEFYINSKLGVVNGERIILSDLIAKSSKCFIYQVSDLSEEGCQEKDVESLREVLAFTQWSQDLLLKDKTKELLQAPESQAK